MSNTESQRVAIPPPQEAVYDSHDAAESALHQWTRDHGFNVSRRRVRYTDGPDRQVWARNYECNRAGAPKNTQHTKSSSRINQPPVTNLQGLVELQTSAGVTSSTILATILSADPNSLVVAKDISNSKDAVRRRDLASRAAIEALFEEFKENNFFYKFQVNSETSEVTHLIWATLQLRSGSIFTMMSSSPTCWLPGEKEGDYVWALNMLRLRMIENDVPCPKVILTDRELACMNALDRGFPDTPSMVWRWHMNKNVESMA
ncbi:hypothetical protein PC119_g22021 [Phytophthora cactorum]|nr:hypothetical protein PC119_g22021 [Phytophthora cactorum]